MPIYALGEHQPQIHPEAWVMRSSFDQSVKIEPGQQFGLEPCSG